MKPFKQIEELKKVITELKYNHQFIKDKVRIVKSAERINTLIDSVEMFESVLLSKFKTDALDRLFYSLIYEWLIQFQKIDDVKDYYLTNTKGERKLVENKNYGKLLPLPIKLMIHNLQEDLRYHSSYKKKQIIDLLETRSKRGEHPPYKLLLEDLVMKFKTDMKWIK